MENALGVSLVNYTRTELRGKSSGGRFLHVRDKQSGTRNEKKQNYFLSPAALRGVVARLCCGGASAPFEDGSGTERPSVRAPEA